MVAVVVVVALGVQVQSLSWPEGKPKAPTPKWATADCSQGRHGVGGANAVPMQWPVFKKNRKNKNDKTDKNDKNDKIDKNNNNDKNDKNDRNDKNSKHNQNDKNNNNDDKNDKKWREQ